jgi:Carbohydrate family 9 binding domain-like/Domain of unknown function (DUF5916)
LKITVRGIVPALATLSFAFSSLTGSANAAEAMAPKSFEIVRIAEGEAPVIDGRIDEAVWQRAAAIRDFRQFQPLSDAEASERTEFYVMYDKDTLYVGARLWDSEPDKITANILRQGERLNNEDKVSVILDTFNDKRNGYRFEVNPNGIRDDALYLDTTQLQWEWEGIYAAQAARDGEGWTAEMAIPFKTLSFDPANDTWGINFSRFIGRNNERIGWVFRNRNQTPSSSGLVTGLDDMNQGLGLDAVPGVSFRQEKNHVAGTNEFSVEPSLDIYYKVTPGLNASLTFNTDFSATEADARQVNLSRFSLFYPEKRAFFLRESDIFEFGRIKGGNVPATINPTFSRASMENGRPFFSRRIGLGLTGDPVDIIAGGKLSGRVGGFNVGALAIRQDEQVRVDARNLLVARGVANVLEESSLGLIATSGDPRSNLDNSLVGADFRYTNNRLASGRSLEGELWYQQSTTEGLSGDDAAYGLRLRSPNNTGLYAGAGMKELQANFNPALGYVNRRDIRTYTGEMGYTRRFTEGFIQAARSGVDFEQFIGLGSGDLETQTVTYRLAEVFSRLNDQFKFFYISSREVLTEPFEISPGVIIPVGDYSFGENELSLEAAGSRFLSGGITWSQGDFYDGERLKLQGEVVWKASPHFWFTGSYEYNDVTLPEGDFIVRLMSTRFDLMFTHAWSWVTLVQYDNVSDSVAGQTRIRYVPQAGREMYFVFNHNLLDENEDGTFTSTRADATVKFNYTFRF